MEQRLFEDNQLTAYLISQKKYPVRYKPVRESGKIKFLLSGDGLEQAIQNFFGNDEIPVQESGKIKFLLSGDGLEQAIQNFFANGEIPVQDYLSAFTTLKNIVAGMKDRR